MPANVIVQHLTGNSPGVAVPVSLGMRFRSDDGDGADQVAPVILPAALSTNLTAPVTLSNDSQSVKVASSTGISTGNALIVAPGQPTQEVVSVTSVPDGTHISAIFQQNHVLGAPVTLVTASFAKTLQVKLLTPPITVISKLRFLRVKPLPIGVYDQYSITGSYTPSNGTPFTSAADTVFLACPTLSEEIFATGPISVTGIISPLLVIQWLYTSAASGPLDMSAYRLPIWDES